MDGPPRSSADSTLHSGRSSSSRSRRLTRHGSDAGSVSAGYFGRRIRVTLPRLSTTRIGKGRMSSPSSIWEKDACARNIGDGIRFGSGVIHQVPEIPHRSRGNDAQGVRDAAIQEPGHQLRREHRLAPVAVLRAGTAAVLHRHLRARAVRLTTVAVKRRGRLRADEVRVRAPRARHQTESFPDRTEAEDMTHLVADDLVELASREEASDIGRVEVHHADTRLKTRIADETRTSLTEDLPWTVDRIEPDVDDDVVDGLVDHGRTRATRARREAGKL